ncbi:MAG: M20/M25/M40 family metallo-hydrolase [Acidobacteriales bacterium]|nr:M20/M25/M40 family metallo-hydrolase [Terriglobales bacterium]
MNRRDFIATTAAAAAALAVPEVLAAAGDELAPIFAEIARQHDANLRRLQYWIQQPAIAAENRANDEGAELMMQMLRDAGFQMAKKMPTAGHPGVFATLDAGAPKTLGLYFMFDVKQADPAEWISPPFEARVLDRPGLGKALIGRGAVNQKGPEATFLAALHAIRAAGRKLPVNLVLVAEGEEEIGSPHIKQIVDTPEVQAALKKTVGVFMPHAAQGLDGNVTLFLGAKGVIELELISSGEKWGRGPKKDIHSSNKARVDSPAWHLVQALNTLVKADGTPDIDNFTVNARPISAAEKALVAKAAATLDEAIIKKGMGVDKWINDVGFRESLERLVSQPTVNIEGLVGGYTGPGGKTILPGRAVAKLDLRLVPDMTAKEALAALKAHLAKRGFGDIEVNMSGGYDPTSTAGDSAFIQAQVAAYKASGVDPTIMPRLAGSYPGYAFTDPPLSLPAGHFGLCNGNGAHAPDEYFLIESSNPKVQGMDGGVRSYVEYLYAIAKTA